MKTAITILLAASCALGASAQSLTFAESEASAPVRVDARADFGGQLAHGVVQRGEPDGGHLWRLAG